MGHGSGFRFTPEQTDVIRRRWNEGVVLKAIAYEVEAPYYSVRNKVRALGLPERRRKLITPGGQRRHMLRVNVDEPTLRKVGALALSRNIPVSEYIRRLIVRDIGS